MDKLRSFFDGIGDLFGSFFVWILYLLNGQL